MSRFTSPPRVLVVSPLDGGSLPIAGYAAAALSELGAEVSYADMSWLAAPPNWRVLAASPEARMELVDYASSLVVALARRERPDLCLALAQAPLHPRALDALRGLGVSTAYWFVENYRVTRYWQDLARHYEWFFTAQHGAFHERLAEAGCPRARWLPLAASPSVHAPKRLSVSEKERYGSEVSFAGYGYFNRRELLGGILDYDLKVWGPGFAGSALESRVQRSGAAFDAEEFCRIAAAGAVHVNLHSATHVPGVDPDGDYLNPRVFELSACGAFQLCDRRSDLGRAFRVPEEIVTFDDLRSLRESIEYYLAHADERRAVAAAARQRVLSEHTYRHRMAEVLEQVVGPKTLPGASRRTAGLSDYPKIASAELRAASDLGRLADELAGEEHASDDEVLLRIAGIGGLRSR